jgi:hypothetical protein
MAARHPHALQKPRDLEDLGLSSRAALYVGAHMLILL